MECKFIRCSVAPLLHERFSQSQSAWKAIAGCRGFLNQYGGWDIPSGEAVVMSSWVDEKSIFQFMKETHDGVAELSKQKETYTKSSVSYLHEVFSLPGCEYSPHLECEFIRLVRCRVIPSCEQLFLDLQARIWNPGISGTEGMRGGTLWRDSNEKQSYLVVSFWRKEADHQRYVTDILPKLLQSANKEKHIANTQSWEIVVEPDWYISPAHKS